MYNNYTFLKKSFEINLCFDNSKILPIFAAAKAKFWKFG